jgi:hypothetical protein
MKQYISNQARTVFLPWEPGMIEWLQANYPYSQYHVVQVA